MVKRQKLPVASVCLYGAGHVGYGYLAGPPANPAQFGDGEPHKPRGLNDAFWLAMFDLQEAGIVGMVKVFAPGGELMAQVSNAGAFPYYGQLEWGPAEMLVVSMADILAASENH